MIPHYKQNYMYTMCKKKSIGTLLIFFVAVSVLIISCNKSIVREELISADGHQAITASIDEVSLLSTDSIVSESEIYQVFIDDNPILTQKEICYDYASNGGEREVHTALFTYRPGTQIKIVCNSAFTDYTISPQRLNISSTHNGNEISFTSPSAYYNFIVDIPGHAPLFLMSAPNLSSYKEGAVVFERGVHTAPNDEFILQSNTTYYLEEGAVLNGKVIIKNANNVKIFGRGYIDDRRSPVLGNLVKIYNSQNIEIKGIGIRHGALGWQTDLVNSKDVKIAFINLLSFGQNNDGLDVGTGCENIRFSHCLVGSGDDAFGWHATNAVAYGQDPLNICNANDCLIWQTAGCGIRIGNSLETTEVKNIKFKNIDIAKSSQGIYSIAIPHSDWANVHHLIFEEIHDERPNNDKFVLAYIKETPSSNPVYQPGHISNVDFINCSSYAHSAVFEGYDSTHMISNVKFKNVKVAGRDMLPSDIVANAYTQNIVVE